MKIILWEYKTLELVNGVSTTAVMNMLNEQGSIGWELVSVRDRQWKQADGSQKSRTIFILKRPCGQGTV